MKNYKAIVFKSRRLHTMLTINTINVFNKLCNEVKQFKYEMYKKKK